MPAELDGSLEDAVIRRRLTPYALLLPGTAWLVVFFLIPIYLMLRLSLNSGTLETGLRFDWNWDNYRQALSLYDTQFLRSFYYAGSATILALLIAYPLAYGIVFHGGRRKNILLFLVLAPFFTTYLIRTLAWETILADESPVVKLLDGLGIVLGGHVLATGGAVIAGITYNFVPFMVLPIYASLERTDKRLMEAAHDLHASPWATFWHVIAPLSAPGVVAGALLTFIPAVGDYINAQFLGGPNNRMIGNIIQSLYLTQRDYPAAAALSFILMALIMVAVFIYLKFAGSDVLMGDEAT